MLFVGELLGNRCKYVCFVFLIQRHVAEKCKVQCVNKNPICFVTQNVKKMSSNYWYVKYSTGGVDTSLDLIFRTVFGAHSNSLQVHPAFKVSNFALRWERLEKFGFT